MADQRNAPFPHTSPVPKAHVLGRNSGPILHPQQRPGCSFGSHSGSQLCYSPTQVTGLAHARPATSFTAVKRPFSDPLPLYQQSCCTSHHDTRQKRRKQDGSEFLHAAPLCNCYRYHATANMQPQMAKSRQTHQQHQPRRDWAGQLPYIHQQTPIPPYSCDAGNDARFMDNQPLSEYLVDDNTCHNWHEGSAAIPQSTCDPILQQQQLFGPTQTSEIAANFDISGYKAFEHAQQLTELWGTQLKEAADLEQVPDFHSNQIPSSTDQTFHNDSTFFGLAAVEDGGQPTPALTADGPESGFTDTSGPPTVADQRQYPFPLQTSDPDWTFWDFLHNDPLPVAGEDGSLQARENFTEYRYRSPSAGSGGPSCTTAVQTQTLPATACESEPTLNDTCYPPLPDFDPGLNLWDLDYPVPDLLTSDMVLPQPLGYASTGDIPPTATLTANTLDCYQTPRHPPSARDTERDRFLIECKKKGLSYKDIRKIGHFTEAESTLRGRYRTLTKRKEERVRKPRWTPRDVSALVFVTFTPPCRRRANCLL